MVLNQINTFENLAPGHLKYKDYKNGWQQLVASTLKLQVLPETQFAL